MNLWHNVLDVYFLREWWVVGEVMYVVGGGG